MGIQIISLFLLLNLIMPSTFSNIKASNEIISTEEPLIHLIIISFGLINSRAALLFGLHRKDLIDRLDLSVCVLELQSRSHGVPNVECFFWNGRCR